MSKIDISIVIGGPQGGGIDTSSNMITRAFSYSGFPVISVREFHSNIKGRHSYVHLRVKDEKPKSFRYPVDVLVALDPDTIFEHFEDIGKGSKIIYDTEFETSDLSQARMIMRDTAQRIKNELESKKQPLNIKGVLNLMKENGGIPIGIPFSKVVTSVVSEGPATRYFNTLGASVTLSILGVDKDSTKSAIKDIFGNKEKVIEPNLKVVDSSYDYCETNGFKIRDLGKMPAKKVMLLTGNDGAAIGKIIGGLRFQTYYPITPASDESTILEEHDSIKWLEEESQNLKRGGVTVIQTEDEISAITMACGAALTGTRSSTATSGPGFSLMAEGISFAGMDEIPVVITLYQRGGPSTGLPTRNQQSDLLFALNTGHGEFPRIVMSSGDVEECIYDSIKALNYAQRYQLPVIHLIDKTLANTTEVVDSIDPDLVPIIGRVSPEKGSEIKRYSLNTENGISAMGTFGNNIFWMTGDEHDELGHVTEDSMMRDRQMEKRFRKIETARKEIPVSEMVQIIGDEKADITLVTWGSQKSLVIDILDDLSREGIRAKLLYLRMFQPFPSEFVSEVLKKSRKVISIESNMTSQAATVIRTNTGIEIKNNIVKYNGRHMTEDELLSAVKKIIEGKSEREVLRNGA